MPRKLDRQRHPKNRISVQKVNNNEAFIISVCKNRNWWENPMPCKKFEMADPAQKPRRVGQQLEPNILGSSIYETKRYWVPVSTNILGSSIYKPLLDTSSGTRKNQNGSENLITRKNQNGYTGFLYPRNQKILDSSIYEIWMVASRLSRNEKWTGCIQTIEK